MKTQTQHEIKINGEQFTRGLGATGVRYDAETLESINQEHSRRGDDAAEEDAVALVRNLLASNPQLFAIDWSVDSRPGLFARSNREWRCVGYVDCPTSNASLISRAAAFEVATQIGCQLIDD